MGGKQRNENELVVGLKILNQIGASILSEFTIEQMIDTVYEHVNKLMDAYSFAIGIYNPLTERIEYIGEMRLIIDVAAGGVLLFSTCICN
jgi:hypothetical protein